MNPTTELLSKLNTMQSEHIKLLNERIDKQAKKIESYSSAIDGMHIVIKELKNKVKVLSNACKGKDKLIYKLKNELRSNKE